MIVANLSDKQVLQDALTSKVIYIKRFDKMEDHCFASYWKPLDAKKGKNYQENRLALGLVYPIYIITSSYNSPHLTKLQREIEKQHISLGFQSSLNSLAKITKTYQRKYFLLLNDFAEQPVLGKQFEQLQYEVMQFPKSSIDDIFKAYYSFVDEQEKKKNLNNSLITAGGFQQMKESNISKFTKQNTVCSNPSDVKPGKIQVRSVSRLNSSSEANCPKKLFIYCNKNDEIKYTQYVNDLKKYDIEDAVVIEQIEDYIRYLPIKGDSRYYVMMSEFSALNLRQYFKKSDEILLMADSMEKCLPLLRGKITQMACDSQTMNKIISNSFKMKSIIEEKSSTLIEMPLQRIEQVDEMMLQTNSQGYKSAQIHNEEKQATILSKTSSSHFKIIPQYTIINENHKQLSLQSDILQCFYDPLKEDALQLPSKPELHIGLSNNPMLPNKKTNIEQIKASPLKIVHLDNISMVSLDIRQSECSHDQQIFASILNKMSNESQANAQSQKAIKRLQKREDYCLRAYEAKGSSMFQESSSQNSRMSNRTNRNSRIISKIQEYKKGNRPRPPISLITKSDGTSIIQVRE